MADHYDDYTREELIRLLRERDRKPKFGLVWERDEIEHEKAINDDFVALNFDAGLSCGEAPFRNLIIEGDNFDALRFLRMTHAGKVKCIYIDPPYNTGNRDFIYNDRFIDKEDTYKHSKWLEFMYRRLELAKELLAEDGVIFVSIDDNEVFNLGLLMNRIFGEKNRLATLVWQTNGNFDNQARFKICHEYVFVYSVNENLVPAPSVIDPNIEETGKLFREEIRNTIVKNGPKNPVSDIMLPIGFPADFDNGIIKSRMDLWPQFLSNAEIKDWKLTNSVVVRSGWANKRLCERFIENRFYPVYDTKNQLTSFIINQTGAIDNIKIRNEEQSHVISVIKNIGSVQSAGAELLTHQINFSYPKPVGLISFLLSMIRGKDFTVMDFFAGSGTTAHAVLKLNREDGGNRRFILVSNTEATADAPDKNLCRDVCAERVRRVIAGYRNKKGEWVEGLSGDLLKTHGASFAYLRARRIPAEMILSQIEHEQVWTALQLIHTETLTPFDAAVLVQRAETENGVMLYVPKVSEAVIETLEQAIHDAGTAVIYSWQPGWLHQHIEDERASFQPIPQFLVNRFNLGART